MLLFLLNDLNRNAKVNCLETKERFLHSQVTNELDNQLYPLCFKEHLHFPAQPLPLFCTPTAASDCALWGPPRAAWLMCAHTHTHTVRIRNVTQIKSKPRGKTKGKREKEGARDRGETTLRSLTERVKCFIQAKCSFGSRAAITHTFSSISN